MGSGTLRYETHVHTSESSACASASACDMVCGYIDAGYAGMVVTDHFLNGNTTVPRDLPWEERIHLFCRGYENARAAGETRGFQVFLGWEASFAGSDFLTYGLDREFLLRHPDMLAWSVGEYLDSVRSAGGFVIHAHPFREAPHIPEIRLFPDQIDAVEVVNGSHFRAPRFDDRALAHAEEFGLLQTSGSDAHHLDSLGSGGMAFDREMRSIEELIAGIRAPDSARLLRACRV